MPENEKRILHVEDVEGNDYEFELILPAETWKDISKLYVIGLHQLREHHKNMNDITNVSVLTLN